MWYCVYCPGGSVKCNTVTASFWNSTLCSGSSSTGTGLSFFCGITSASANKDAARNFTVLLLAMLKAGRSRGWGSNFRSVHPEAQVRKVSLAERHQAGVQVAPHEKQQKRNRGEILVGNRVDHGKSKINSQQDFRVGHPPGLVAIFFR